MSIPHIPQYLLCVDLPVKNDLMCADFLAGRSCYFYFI